MNNKSIYKSIRESTKDIVLSFFENIQNNYLIPTKFISVEAGQVGYLLNELYNIECSKSEKYKTFFCNSRFEGLQGTIKIIRQYMKERKSVEGKIYFYSEEKHHLENIFNPLCTDKEEMYLVPYVCFYNDFKQMMKDVCNNDSPMSVIYSVSNIEQVSERYDSICSMKSKSIITAFEFSDLAVSEIASVVSKLDGVMDAIVIGESMTNYELPFGAFSVNEEISSPWGKMDTCLTHSSTYGGGRIVLTKVKESLLAEQKLNKNNIIDVLESSEKSDKMRIRLFAEYVNHGMTKLYKLTGLDVHPFQAKGNMLKIKRHNKVFHVYDCITGGGGASRGHMPDDILEDVLKKHDIKKDYWKELCEKLTEKTGYEHFFPSVSGANAVENAIIIALLANPGRKKILLFNNNYAGKTLVSLICTTFEEDQKSFEPLYQESVCLDLDDKDIEQKLKRILSSGEIALVWMETVQGNSGFEIPDNILKIINNTKDFGGYLIGVDEILASFYRTSNTLFHHRIVKPDIVTISKGLTDSMIPIGVTLVNKEIHQKGIKKNAELIEILEKMYVNQLSAHIAIHSIEKIVDNKKLQSQMPEVKKVLRSGFEEIVKKSNIVERIIGEDFLYHIEYNYDNVFIKLFGDEGREIFPLFMCRNMYLSADVLMFFEKFVFPINLSIDDARTLIEKLKRYYNSNNKIIMSFILFMIKYKILRD